MPKILHTKKLCVNFPNKWVNFIFVHKFCKETRCFLKKFTELEKFYTTAGRDGGDKFQVCHWPTITIPFHPSNKFCSTTPQKAHYDSRNTRTTSDDLRRTKTERQKDRSPEGPPQALLWATVSIFHNNNVSFFVANCPAVLLLYLLLWICSETQLINTKIKMSKTSRLSLVIV